MLIIKVRIGGIMSREKLQNIDKFVTVTELCEILNMGRNTIYRWTHRKKIPAHRIGGTYRYNLTEVLRITNTMTKAGGKHVKS